MGGRQKERLEDAKLPKVRIKSVIKNGHYISHRSLIDPCRATNVACCLPPYF